MSTNRLLDYRERLQLSRRQLAAKSGISHETIRRLEIGYEPSFRVARVLADFFHTEIDVMFPEAWRGSKAGAA